MTIDQWYNFAVKEWERWDEECTFPKDPQDWQKQRVFILNHIKNVDELTEIYNNEQRSK